jgi:hypothetical protein
VPGNAGWFGGNGLEDSRTYGDTVHPDVSGAQEITEGVSSPSTNPALSMQESIDRKHIQDRPSQNSSREQMAYHGFPNVRALRQLQ